MARSGLIAGMYVQMQPAWANPEKDGDVIPGRMRLAWRNRFHAKFRPRSWFHDLGWHFSGGPTHSGGIHLKPFHGLVRAGKVSVREYQLRIHLDRFTVLKEEFYRAVMLAKLQGDPGRMDQDITVVKWLEDQPE